MQTKISSSVVLGIIIFVALIPLCFFIQNNKALYLIASNYSWLAWAAAIIAMVLCAVFRNHFSGKQLAGLWILFALIPLSFQFNEQGAHFLILSNAPALATAYWSVALGFGINLYKKSKRAI